MDKNVFYEFITPEYKFHWTLYNCSLYKNKKRYFWANIVEL